MPRVRIVITDLLPDMPRVVESNPAWMVVLPDSMTEIDNERAERELATKLRELAEWIEDGCHFQLISFNPLAPCTETECLCEHSDGPDTCTRRPQ